MVKYIYIKQLGERKPDCQHEIEYDTGAMKHSGILGIIAGVCAMIIGLLVLISGIVLLKNKSDIIF